MPCLNEEDALAATCKSLGFGFGISGATEGVLIVVDNGSTDRTMQIALGIQRNSPVGSVLIVSELEKGFVPARLRGANEAINQAKLLGLPFSRTMLLQVDADADYSPNYVNGFIGVANRFGKGHLFEAESVPPGNMTASEHDLMELLHQFDSAFFDSLGLENIATDCVVDDKMVGFILSDWIASGGITRDWACGKEMIYCGTSRFWVRMLAKGFTRILVEDSRCAHSMRKISEGADIYAATGGWPRGTKWKHKWRQRFPERLNAAEFIAAQGTPIYEATLESRQVHLEAIFRCTPNVLMGQIAQQIEINPASILIDGFDSAGLDLREDLV